MTPFKKEAEIMLTVLETAYIEIENRIVNPDIFAKKNKILNDLKKHIYILKNELELPIDDNEKPTSHTEPLTKMFGKILIPEPVHNDVVNEEEDNDDLDFKTPLAAEKKQNEQIAEEYENKIIHLKSDEIVNSIDEEIIISLAKEAGVKTDGLPILEVADRTLTALKLKNAAKLNLTNQDIASLELKKDSKTLYDDFLTIDNDKLLGGEYDELVIRGVGKLAGLPVTDESPKKVDDKFIKNIKEAIKVKRNIETV